MRFVVTLQALPIRTKLIVAFSILTVFIMGLGLLGILGTLRMREQALHIETNWLPSIRVLGEIDTLTARNSAVILRHAQETDAQKQATIEGDLVRFGKKLEEKKKSYETMIASPGERDLYDAYTREAAKFAVVRDAIMDLSRSGEKAQAFALYETKGLAIRRGVSEAL